MNEPERPSKPHRAYPATPESEAIGTIKEFIRDTVDEQKVLAESVKLSKVGQTPLTQAYERALRRKMTVYCMLRAFWHGKIHGAQYQPKNGRLSSLETVFIDKHQPGHVVVIKSLGDVRTFIQTWTGRKRGSKLFNGRELAAIQDVLDLFDQSFQPKRKPEEQLQDALDRKADELAGENVPATVAGSLPLAVAA
jgi:hypothetical protein